MRGQQMRMKISVVLAAAILAGLALLSGCAGPQVIACPGPGQYQAYSVQGNQIYIENGPVVTIEDSLRFVVPERVP